MRTGCEKTVVQAAFFIDENHPSCMLAQEAGISVEEQLIFTREVTAAGRSICRINATLVTASLLRHWEQSLWISTGNTNTNLCWTKADTLRLINILETIRQAKAVKEGL